MVYGLAPPPLGLLPKQRRASPLPDFADPQPTVGRKPDPFWFDFKTRDGPPLKQIDLKHWYTAASEGIQSALSGRT